ncbi:tautomerase family protein [Ottowia thiooxydans]|uniref:tautomerase family protein n=1 Tax=Ottowia thiooxydans TaxID=219182 RepID=UPI0003FBE1BC|nr:tautomerase family protein [Ottowia thiooxydans]
MPMLQAFFNRDYPSPVRAELCAAYTRCIVEALDAPLAQVRVLLASQPADSVSVGGRVGEGISLLHIYLMPGRTDEQKALLIGALTAATSRWGEVPAASVRVLFHDMPKANVGIGGITAVALGR